MTLAPGVRLGPFEVTTPLGRGGMGEVWRARDTKLHRDVAVKILPEAFAHDADRLARFEREARTLASLNHPNIAQVYGLEESRGGGSSDPPALVMELVEGPTLADRIAQGPVPLDEALPIAKQIAEALEAAHEQGIVHRDLKPANIKLRPDGTVKVLDFGLAKAMESGPAGPSSTASMSPTITSPALTGRNVILGTAAYMSPEQARGKPVDKRTDIWAFGCVVYEMLSGRRAFDGDDVTVTLARVVEREPDWTAVSAQPPGVRALLRRCLEKDPRRRMRDIGDARLALERVFDIVVPADRPAFSGPESADAPVSWRRRARPWLLGASAGIVVTAAVAWVVMREMPSQPEYLRLASEPLAPLLVSTFHRDIAISPDGRRVAMTTRDDTWRIEIISLDSREPITLVSEGQPFGPFFSYDGDWVGFYDQKSSQLRRVRANGDGRVETIGSIGTGQVRGATWGRDGTIVYGSTNRGLWRLTPRTGEPERFNEPEPLTITDGTGYHHWPSLLPGDEAVLFTVITPGSTTMQLAVASLDTGTVTPLGIAGSAPRYVPAGHLLYAVNGALRAVPFDPALQIATGASSAVEANVLLKSSGAASFDVSESGTLVFLPTVASQPRTLGLVTPTGTDAGQMSKVLAEGPDFFQPRLSRDESRILFWQFDASGLPQVYLRDRQRENSEQLTTGQPAMHPVWGPGEADITFSRASGPGQDLWGGPVRGPWEPLETSLESSVTGSWCPDGQTLVYYRIAGKTRRDIWKTSPGEPQEAILNSPEDERTPRLSPDCRWLAYVSDRLGEDHIYIAPWPELEPKLPILKAGASEPVWSRDGRELYFRVRDEMWAVRVPAAPGSPPQELRLLFEAPYEPDPWVAGIPNYDVAKDGRFLMVRSNSRGSESITLVRNFVANLPNLAPTD